ncbi:hypothetical protein PM082_008697 [Marasmius tenuissimus]|nr:hypothetical protein PM082_008697 [Marasmius tenuissimus]
MDVRFPAPNRRHSCGFFTTRGLSIFPPGASNTTNQCQPLPFEITDPDMLGIPRHVRTHRVGRSAFVLIVFPT